jgi:hypothetical protein
MFNKPTLEVLAQWQNKQLTIQRSRVQNQSPLGRVKIAKHSSLLQMSIYQKVEPNYQRKELRLAILSPVVILHSLVGCYFL